MKQPFLTTAALVFFKKKLLLVRSHKWNNTWCIPGGKVDWGEALQDALKREIKEETGLKINKIKFIMVQEMINPKDFWKPSHFVSLNYSCEADSDKVKLYEEAEGFVWMRPKDALKLKLNAPTRELIEAFLCLKEK